MSNQHRWIVLVGVVVALVLVESSAHAGGFTYPANGSKALGRGGAYMLGVTGPEALYFNPAILSRVEGTQLTLDLNIHKLNLEFTRLPETDDMGNTTSYAKVENLDEGVICCGFFPAPMLFVSSDFGLDDFGFAAGVFGPNGIGKRVLPADGAQRYQLIESELLQIYPSVAAAWRTGGLRLGATFSLVYLRAKLATTTSGALTSLGQDPDDETPVSDVITRLDVSAFNATGILGVAYDVTPGLSFGLSYQLPVKHKLEGTAELEGELLTALDARLNDDTATFKTTEADVIRAGARWAWIDGGREVLDVEFQTTYELWSRLEAFEITIPGRLVLGDEGTPFDIREAGQEDDGIGTSLVPKNWKNSLSLRLGMDYNPLPWLTTRGGGYYETAAAPTAHTHPDFLTFDRIGGSMGVTFYVGPVDIDLAYTHVRNQTREVKDGAQKIVAPLADGGTGTKAINNGEWISDVHHLSLGVTWRFDSERDGFTPKIRDL